MSQAQTWMHLHAQMNGLWDPQEDLGFLYLKIGSLGWSEKWSYPAPILVVMGRQVAEL